MTHSTFDDVYIQNIGAFLPGPAISNEKIDEYIEPLNRFSKRIKNKILQENGIKTRHYALDNRGDTLFSTAGMAANAVRTCLQQAGLSLKEVSLLCTGTSGADTVVPGFANMVQGELGAPPMETSSHQGVCAAGVAALKYACMSIQAGYHERALVAVSEFPSRLFKKTRFAPRDYDTDFDSHFLRWMLSDGAGAMLLGRQPSKKGVSLKVNWIHLKSHSGDYPVCMQAGFPEDNRPKSFQDYPSFAAAEKDGALLLRQDVRLLPQLFDIGIHEFARLVKEGAVNPNTIDYFLCHYSSEKFAPAIKDLLEKANLSIPSERWYSNLKTRGNTGSASIFIMLEEFLRTHNLKNGQRILCFVPESGRFTVGYILLEVIETKEDSSHEVVPDLHLPEPPHVASLADSAQLGQTLRELALVWHDFRSRLFRTPFVQKIIHQQVNREDYLAWMANWIPQVREGSLWMRKAASNLCEPYSLLKDVILHHAGEEQYDFKVLFEDYRNAGGQVPSIDLLKRNSGGEALNAFMYHRAAQANAVDLLGGIYIIEGTGSRIIPTLLPLLRKQLPFSDGVFRFLRYHGDNDQNHLQEWRQAVSFVLEKTPDDSVVASIVDTARTTAGLYLMQMENVR